MASPKDPVTQRSDALRRLQAALGRDYELGELLGRGGFAEVYLAWDRRLKREVAVKTIRAELFASPDVMERFRREAEAIGRLRHPHIVPVYSVGEGEGVAYFIMPRIRGESLAEAMEREKRWGFADVVRILREAAGALAEAHRSGIVHRDIKPENIMIDGPERRVVVMDFGIAKSFDTSGAEAGLTATGMLLGTPHYMSPEQAVGEGHVDHLSDQYSLAMVGYRLLTGRLPFDADSVRSLLHQQAAVTVTPMQELRPDIPAPLARIIERALEKEPSRRYASMDEFAEALARVASAVAGEFRIGRRTAPMSERWATARQQLYAYPKAMVIAAVLGIVAFVIAYPMAEPAMARKVAGQRAEAGFVAREWMKSYAGVTGVAQAQYLYSNDRLYRFAQKALSGDSLTARLGRDIRVWRWSSTFYRADPVDSWFAIVAPDLRVVNYSYALPSRIKSIPDQGDSAALALERRVLSGQGWQPTNLVFLRRTLVPTQEYTRRSATWRVPSRALVAGRDTAHYEVYVATVGTAATSYSEGLSIPEQFRSGIQVGTRKALAAASLITLLACALAALLVAAKRAGRDTLQWRMAATLGGVGLIVLLLTFVFPTTPAASVPSWSGAESRLLFGMNHILGLAPQTVGLWVCTTFWMLTAESLLYEKRPDLTAGLADVSRGRFLIPEIVPAALTGYGVGFATLGAGYAVAVAMHRWSGVPLPSRLNLPWAFEIGMPALGVVHVVGPALWFASLALFFIAVLTTLRVPWGIAAACLLTGMTFGLYLLGETTSPELRVLLEGLSMVAMAWLMNRHGFLAALIAMITVLGVPIATDLVWAGGETFFTSGLLGFAFLLLPGAAAVVTYRRRRVTPA